MGCLLRRRVVFRGGRLVLGLRLLLALFRGCEIVYFYGRYCIMRLHDSFVTHVFGQRTFNLVHLHRLRSAIVTSRNWKKE